MRLRDRTSALFGCAAVVVAVLIVGGAFRWTQAIVAGLVGCALIPQLWSRRVLMRKSPLIIVLGLATALTLLQLLPLPEMLLRSLNLAGNVLRADGAALFDVSPWQAITLDAPGTLRGLAFFIILLAVATLALRFSASERGRFMVIASVTGTIGLAALVVVVHLIFGATSLYGWYEPAQQMPPILGPLINPNHLGSLMAIGAVAAFGLVMYRSQPSWMRAGWVVLSLACSILTMATLSRGATIALAAGALVSLGVLVGQRLAGTAHSKRRRARLMMTSLPLGVVATCTVLIVILLNAGGVQHELARTSLQEIDQPTSKYAAWKSSVKLIDDAPLVGVGRGGFEAAFTRVHPASGFVTFSHLENEYVQAVVDWGIVGTALLAIALLYFAVMAIRRWRDGPLSAAALGCCVALGLQSNFDFGVELLGLAIPITAIAATLSYVPLREGEPREIVIGRLLRVFQILALAVAVILLVLPITTSIGEDHEELSERSDVTYEELREMAERHPLDYYLYARAASVLAHQGDQRALRLLNHALRLHPTHPGLHRMAGHLLLESKRPDQAALEYAAALQATREPQKLLEEILEKFPADKAAAAIPPDFADLNVVIKILRELGHPEIATAWLNRVLAANPRDVQACELLYMIALREDNLAAAETAGRNCVEILPDRTTRLSLAKVLIKRKSYTEVIRLLQDVESWPGRIDDKVAGWFLLCDSHEGLLNWEAAKRCVRHLEVSGYIDPQSKLEITKRLERIEQAKRDLGLGIPGFGPAPGSGSAGSGSAGSASAGSGSEALKHVTPVPLDAKGSGIGSARGSAGSAK